MKITAKLAYSQLKINRARTIWTIMAITLSTALITAVCSFVASGNAMLVEFLGEDYGVYGSSYQMLLLAPAVILGILIVGMSITVISNVFRISAQERIAQFGILKCTGATQRQIRDTVLYESVWLNIIGIPAGICLGLLIALGGIRLSDFFLEDLNALAHIMIHKIDLSLHFVVSWQAILLSAVFSFLTVTYSAWRPAHKAEKISAIDCIRGALEIQIDSKKKREPKLVGKVFGVEGLLAEKNLKRNHRNFRATVIALSMGVILFISLGGLGLQARGIENYMQKDTEYTVISDYFSDYDYGVNDERSYLHPADAVCGNRITQQLKTYQNLDILGMGNDPNTYHTVLSENLVLPKMKKTVGDNFEYDSAAKAYDFQVEMIVLDQENYEKLCKKAGVSVGSNILLNVYEYNDFGHQKYMTPFPESLEKIELTKADGSTADMQIQGTLTREQMPKELFYPNTRPVRLVVPDTELQGFTWYCSPEDIEDFTRYSNQVLEEEFPGSDDSDMTDGSSTRVYKISDYVKVMNIAISLAIVLMYCFAAMLMLIGLTNVISTLSANVMIRAGEFAVLKSVGMTTEGVKRMLKFESILCSIKALLYGLPIGIGITLLINLPIRMNLPILYEIPWAAILLCMAAVFAITLGTTMYATHKLKNQNIIEAIRAESGK